MTDDAQYHVHDLVGAYVLGAVTPLEATLVEEHLAACDACRQLADELRDAEAMLPALAGEMEPSPGLKSRLMEAVRADATAMPAETVARREDPRVVPFPARPQARRGRERGRFNMLLAFAAVFALVIVGVGIGVWRLWGTGQPAPAMQVALAGTPAQPAIEGSLRYYAGGRLTLDVHGLKSLPPGRVYELWLIRGHYRLIRGVGAFRPSSGGQGQLTAHSDSVAHYTLACLSVERASGASRPTFPLVALGNING